MPSHTRNLRDGQLVIIDATPVTPNELIVELDQGDLSFTETNVVQTIKNRGILHHRRVGDEEELELSFTVKFVQWSYNNGAATGISVTDACMGRGGASAWVSTDETCAPFSVDIQFRVADPCNPGSFEVLTFVKCTAFVFAFREGDDMDTLAVTCRSLSSTPVRTYETP